MLDLPKTKSRRLLNTPAEAKEFKIDFHWIGEWFGARKAKFSALFISIVLGWLLNALLQNYYPDQLRNWLISGSYVSVIFLLGLSQLYFFSFVFLDFTKSLLTSLAICWLLWLKLHQFELNLEVLITTFLTLGLTLWLISIKRMRF